jgi:hypothetical protein
MAQPAWIEKVERTSQSAYEVETLDDASADEYDDSVGPRPPKPDLEDEDLDVTNPLYRGAPPKAPEAAPPPVAATPAGSRAPIVLLLGGVVLGAVSVAGLAALGVVLWLLAA